MEFSNQEKEALRQQLLRYEMSKGQPRQRWIARAAEEGEMLLVECIDGQLSLARQGEHGLVFAKEHFLSTQEVRHWVS
jgi:hypothetical protein